MVIIDEELAKAFLDDPDNVALSNATEITDEAAELLSKYEGELDLSSLTELSDTALKHLSRHKGSMFVEGKVSRLLGQSLGAEVSNYRRIIPKVIENGVERELSFDEGGDSEYSADFILDGIKVHISCIENNVGPKLYVGVAGGRLEKIEERHGKFLCLFAKGAQSALIADELSDGWVDIESGFGWDLSEEEVQMLYQSYRDFYRKHSLGSDAAAEAPSKHEGGDLQLQGLTELSAADAESLSKHKGDLDLDSLTELSDAAAESLSKHKGHATLEKPHQDKLSLSGLTELSDAAVESLSKLEGWLSLDGLTELSNAAAQSLSKHKGGLSLGGLTELSDAAAESLSKHQGELWLSGLKEISDAAAESLSKHQAPIQRGSPPATLSSSWLVVGGARAAGRAESDEVLDKIYSYKVIDEELAKAYLRWRRRPGGPNERQAHWGDPDEVDLSGATAITDGAAEIFSKPPVFGSKPGRLSLVDLTELSDAAAESLSKYEGKINGKDPKEWVESLRQ